MELWGKQGAAAKGGGVQAKVHEGAAHPVLRLASGVALQASTSPSEPCFIVAVTLEQRCACLAEAAACGSTTATRREVTCPQPVHYHRSLCRGAAPAPSGPAQLCKASRLQLVPHECAHRKVGDAAGHVDGAGQRGGLGEAQAGREQEDEELRAARK